MSSTETLEPAKTLEPALVEAQPTSPDVAVVSAWLRAKRFVKFAIVGGSGVVVNMAIFHLCYHLALTSLPMSPRHSISNAVGVLVSIFTNFLLNDSWTWGDRLKGQRRQWFKRLGKYYLMCAAAGLVQLGVAHVANTYLFDSWRLTLLGFDLSPSLAVGLGIVAGIAINFPVSHLWAFKDEG